MIYTEEQIQSFRQQRFAFLKVKEQDHVLWLTLNRPEKKNALSPTLMRELAYALAYAHYTPEIWCIVIGAEGDVFCAGADLKVFAGIPEPPNDSTIPPVEEEILLGELFIQLHKPAIAMVQGPAYAGAFLILCGCHYVVSVKTAHFTLSEVKRGIWPMQVMNSLLSILPPRQVLDWCIRGRTLSAEEAYRIGFVTHLADDYEDLLKQTQALIKEITENSPTAIRYGLSAYDKLRSIPPHERHAFLKQQLNELLKTADAKEGLAAFREKRQPKWTGK